MVAADGTGCRRRQQVKLYVEVVIFGGELGALDVLPAHGAGLGRKPRSFFARKAEDSCSSQAPGLESAAAWWTNAIARGALLVAIR